VGLAPVESGARPSAWNVTVVVQAPAAGGAPPGDPNALILASLKNAFPHWDRDPEIVGGPWASGPFDWPTRRITAPGVVLVGDAAGYFDPLTGQGIYRALRTAEWASEAIDSGLRRGRVSEEQLAEYDRKVRREFRWSRAVQRGVEAVLARRRVREIALGRLAATPDSLDRLLRVTGDVSPAAALLSPSWWLPLLRRPGATPTENPIADRR
jgi:flavin-dependent dehydrogenase